MHRVFDSPLPQLGLLTSGVGPSKRCQRLTCGSPTRRIANRSQSFGGFQGLQWHDFLHMLCDWNRLIYSERLADQHECESAHRLYDYCIKGVAYSMFYHLPVPETWGADFKELLRLISDTFFFLFIPSRCNNLREQFACDINHGVCVSAALIYAI